jgi:cell division septation protein DedD
MTSREKKNGGDFVLESRHLVGLFMLLVVIFGIVFTLGYLLGRSQYDSRLRAAIGKPADADPPAAAPAPKSKGKAENTGAVPLVSRDWSAPKPGAGSTFTPNASREAWSPPKDDAAPSQRGSDWDFYHSAEPKTTEDHLQPPKKTVAAAQPPAPRPAAAPKPLAPPRTSASAGAPLVAKGAIMLQVAAVQREGDALALAQALQQKKFPAFVITPGTDKYYRVQVGPYADAQSATNARHDLEAKGFKSIVKR